MPTKWMRILPLLLFIGVVKVSRARLLGFPRGTYDIMKYHHRAFFPSRSAFNARVSLTFLSQPAFWGDASSYGIFLFRGQGSYLHASRLYASPVTMPIYLACSLPLSCKISYSSLMQISRGGRCPVKPERRNLELYDPSTLPSFFRANISKRAAYRNPEFYVS